MLVEDRSPEHYFVFVLRIKHKFLMKVKSKNTQAELSSVVSIKTYSRPFAFVRVDPGTNTSVGNFKLVREVFFWEFFFAIGVNFVRSLR